MKTKYHKLERTLLSPLSSSYKTNNNTAWSIMALGEFNHRAKWIASWMILGCLLFAVSEVRSADRLLRSNNTYNNVKENETGEGFAMKLLHFFWQSGKSSYQPVWPDMEFGWRLVLGSVVGFFGAALGSVGGVGGGGIFVPMLTLIIGFDPKSSTAISKCMIMGAAGSTVYYNLRLRHPTQDLPLIDYDLALLFQPMLMLGISIGVAFNVMFADWMVTVLLIILFLATSTRALFRGIDTWKNETLLKEEAKLYEAQSKQVDGPDGEYKPLLTSSTPKVEKVPLHQNIYWKELILLVYVWLAFLAVQIIKTYTEACSVEYWVLNALQVPIAASITIYEAVSLFKGTKVIKSRGKEITWKPHLLFLYCCCGIVAGMVGGLLGLGGGFILGPLFLELGIPPQVASATSTFAMTFSSTMSVVQYYMLKRFPVPYAAYFVLVATMAAFTGQHVVRKIIVLMGRASIIVFILALTIFISAISLGGVGIVNMVEKLANQEYMGFENMCYQS
ncbi:sulfite exporter TauE/SafE family protein 3-like [Impatiens glandulifera]|uniref:sulfite exporter TauE/SafE family protein 3-like n=1 Tax=Impatiens glandulifera TaxID=253017 RepID=UPI001FB145C2|nr:sulfite exporter TauE/SafE family protein 3-like [Impatiens glandulifera]